VNKKHAQQRVENPQKISQTLIERADRILSLAAYYEHPIIVLGAWGCGVFGNTPEFVAEMWRNFLIGENAKFGKVFEKVVFAIADKNMANIFSQFLLPKDSHRVEQSQSIQKGQSDEDVDELDQELEKETGSAEDEFPGNGTDRNQEPSRDDEEKQRENGGSASSGRGYAREEPGRGHRGSSGRRGGRGNKRGFDGGFNRKKEYNKKMKGNYDDDY